MENRDGAAENGGSRKKTGERTERGGMAVQGDSWTGKLLNTKERRGDFKTAYYHTAYQKALELSKSGAHAALLCDYVFDVMGRRFTSRALPKDCGIYLAAQVCLAYARFGGDMERLRAWQQGSAADEKETRTPAQPPETEERLQAEEDGRPHAQKAAPLKRHVRLRTKKNAPEKPKKQDPAPSFPSPAGAGMPQGIPYGYPYGQPLYYAYPSYGVPLMPVQGGGIPYAQGMPYGQGQPASQGQMQPYAPYVPYMQPMVYYGVAAPVYSSSQNGTLPGMQGTAPQRENVRVRPRPKRAQSTMPQAQTDGAQKREGIVQPRRRRRVPVSPWEGDEEKPQAPASGGEADLSEDLKEETADAGMQAAETSGPEKAGISPLTGPADQQPPRTDAPEKAEDTAARDQTGTPQEKEIRPPESTCGKQETAAEKEQPAAPREEALAPAAERSEAAGPGPAPEPETPAMTPEMAKIVENTVYNKAATRLWMPGGALDAQQDDDDEKTEEEPEEEERSVRLSVLNTALFILGILAVAFLLMELGVIPTLF